MSKFNIHTLRAKYGEGYCTVINEDTIIPWKPLSIGDYYKYDLLRRQDNVNSSILEDEIFTKCVIDKNYIKDLDWLPAGIVNIVVQNILMYSGPGSIDEFNTYLDHNRQLANSYLHNLVPYIIRAFPCYTLEDVYEMPYDICMLRLAQAESFLLKIGVLKEPFYLTDEQAPKPKKSKISAEDMKHIKDQWEGQRKNLDKERIAAEQAMGSEDESGERARMIKEAAAIYKDKIEKLPHYKKEG